ncbi:MAG TPA: hypothetical protein PLF61_01620, partial [Candidatus Goldiibacteriota bacterium]|nr:hypothetical protein [Candidatus Goldiibacteriota bacterium]
STNTGHFDATFRFNSCDGTGYQARIHSNGCAGLMDPSQLILEMPSGTGVTTLASITNPHGVTILCDAWYTVKIKVSGTNIMMKVWPQGTNEYNGWDINITESTVTCNGVVGFQANEGPTAWDNLKVFSIAGTTNSPRLFDTIPTGISYINGSCSGGTSCGTSGGMITWSVGGTGTDAQIASWRGVVNGACNASVTNTAGIDSNDTPPPAISNAVYFRILCQPTPTSTFTRSPTIAPTNTITMTSTYTRTRTSTPSLTRTLTLTYSRTMSPSPSRTPSLSPSPSPSRTPTPSPSRTPTPTYSQTPTPSPSPSPSRTPTSTPSRTPTSTYTNTVSPSPTYTRTPTPTYSRTPTPSPSPSPSRTPTPTYSRTPSPTLTNTNTRT